MKAKRLRTLEYYRELFRTQQVLPEWKPALADAVARIEMNEHRYRMPAAKTKVPWVFIALVHEMESDCNFERQILNGQRWRDRTTAVPAGLGPWDSWELAAVAGLKRLNLHKVKDWSTGALLKQMEIWNGWGYYSRGVNSPYLWSGSNHGKGVGLFVGDGHYDEKAASRQIGAAVILQALMAAGAYKEAVKCAA